MNVMLLLEFYPFLLVLVSPQYVTVCINHIYKQKYQDQKHFGGNKVSPMVDFNEPSGTCKALWVFQIWTSWRSWDTGVGFSLGWQIAIQDKVTLVQANIFLWVCILWIPLHHKRMIKLESSWYLWSKNQSGGILGYVLSTLDMYWLFDKDMYKIIWQRLHFNTLQHEIIYFIFNAA